MSIRKRERKLKNGKASIRYVATIPNLGGAVFTKTFLRKLDAERWEMEQRTKRDGEPHSAANQSMTVQQLADYWLEHYGEMHLEGSSIIRYRLHLRRQILPYFGNRRLIDLNPAEAEAWLHMLRKDKGLSPKTCNDCLMLFRSILTHAIRWRFIRYNPLSGIRGLKRAPVEFRFWTTAEAKAFLAEVHHVRPELYPVFFLALNTGMRLGEIAGLKWDCVDLARRQLAIKRIWCQHEDRVKETTKTNRARVVPLNSALHGLLLSLPKTDNDGFVLARTVDYKHLAKSLQRLAKAAGVKPIAFHDLRHTFASLWMMDGKPIFELQKLLGHTTIAMTERYSHLAPEHLAGKTEFLDLGVRCAGEVIAFKPKTSTNSRP